MLTVVPAPSPVPEAADVRAKKKKKDKVRSAWISFAGRIVAQVTGAAASVALTLMVVHKVQSGPEAAQAAPAPVRAASLSVAAAAVTARNEPAIAVLPLDNFSGNPAEDAFANGMTEALVAELAQVQELTVISRTSAMQYRGARKPLPEVARELGATHLIEGSLVTGGGRVRVTAQLIEAASDRHVWAHTYERPARDLLAMQADVARTIAQEVRAAIVPTNVDR